MSIFFVLGFTVVIIFLYFYKKYLNGGVCTIKHDLKGKFIIITGASSGLGKYSALDLLDSGAKVVFACRGKQKAEEAMKSIKPEQKGNATFEMLDLCDFGSIKKFATVIKKNYPPIDILINNAGAQPQEYVITKDGYDSFIEGNYLGVVLLTELLLEHFNKDEGRIITLSSLMHGKNDFDEKALEIIKGKTGIKDKYYCSFYGPFNLYGTTKILLMYYTKFIVDCYSSKYPKIKAATVHPGVVRTGFTRFLEPHPLLYKIYIILTPFLWYFEKSTEAGAQTQLYLSYLPFNEFISGAYYVDCKIGKKDKRAENKELQKAAINWTFESLGLKIPYENNC